MDGRSRPIYRSRARRRRPLSLTRAACPLVAGRPCRWSTPAFALPPLRRWWPNPSMREGRRTPPASAGPRSRARSPRCALHLAVRDADRSRSCAVNKRLPKVLPPSRASRMRRRSRPEASAPGAARRCFMSASARLTRSISRGHSLPAVSAASPTITWPSRSFRIGPTQGTGLSPLRAIPVSSGNARNRAGARARLMTLSSSTGASRPRVPVSSGERVCVLFRLRAARFTGSLP